MMGSLVTARVAGGSIKPTGPASVSSSIHTLAQLLYYSTIQALNSNTPSSPNRPPNCSDTHTA